MANSVLFAKEQETMNEAPYGSWESPISAAMVAEGSIRFQSVKLANGKLYWLEGRPHEKGRVALMSWTEDGGEKELLPAQYSVRTRVHEYGGGALLIGRERIYFIEDKDQQIHALLPIGEVTQITSAEKCRFADGSEHPLNGSLFYVLEEHVEEVINSIVQIDPKTGQVTPVASGSDFYSSPRVSPDGKFLTFVCWNHPNMPWDGTELWVLDLDSKEKRLIAGGKEESICNPIWDEKGSLFYVSDRSGWWNLYSEDKTSPIWALDGEMTYPQWTFDAPWVALANGRIYCTYAKNAVNQFAEISPQGIVKPLPLPYTYVANLDVDHEKMALIAQSSKEPSSIVLYDLKKGQCNVIKRSCKKIPDLGDISQPITVQFATGSDNQTAHAFYYPPMNQKFKGPKGEKPPLLVLVHGGPTAHVGPSFKMEIFYWTSRGFAVMNVNYGGSTGYGRPYRQRLNGNWGIVDVEDCTRAALYAVEKGLVDPNRLAIEGASAGGYTTLAALAFRDVFKGGADYFGVSDLESFVSDTHKAESHYIDRLVGVYPEARSIYIERSPLHHIDQIQCPVIIFQGAEDAIVPPSQSEPVYKSLLERNIPTAYFLYEGEQHGFRLAANIQKSLEEEYAFFAKIFGIEIPR